MSKSPHGAVSPRRRQHLGIGVGVLVGFIAVALSAYTEELHAPGPMNPGHADVKCNDCHRPAEGTLRQALQATVRYWVGLRSEPVAVGHLPVNNEHCLDCHDNPKDVHPVYRFFEPRYEEARNAIAPQFCNTCHREHRGERLSIGREFCSNCHEKLSLKKDPVDVPHAELVKTKRWGTCLGCHDFHGNHRMTLPEVVRERIPDSDLSRYTAHGPSPYGKDKKFRALKELNRHDG